MIHLVWFVVNFCILIDDEKNFQCKSISTRPNKTEISLEFLQHKKNFVTQEICSWRVDLF